jgi:hypothetical protein
MPLHEDEFQRWLLDWCDGVELPRPFFDLLTEFFEDLHHSLEGAPRPRTSGWRTR